MAVGTPKQIIYSTDMRPNKNKEKRAGIHTEEAVVA